MKVDIIPFGKYQGKPLEVLKQDVEYVKWLQTQSWFKLRYQNINNLIINNFGQPSETPEHNKIQTLFLSKDFCKLLIDFMVDNELLQKFYYIEKKIKNDTSEMLIPIPSLTYLEHSLKITKPVVPLYTTVKEKVFYNYDYLNVFFEIDGIDVILQLKEATLHIEIKPNLSDDYPAVLRQMMANKSNVLLIASFDAIGANLNQVKEIFFKSKIRVLLLTDFYNFDMEVTDGYR